MKTKNIVLALFISFFVVNGYAQEKTKKQLKEEQKIEKQKQIEILVNSKEFVFVARNASPLGFRTIDLTSNSNYLKFYPDLIKSEMPYFGKAYGGIGYGGDGGLKFEGKPQDYTIEKTNKQYRIKAVVKGERDVYSLLLSVYFGGSATLSVSSNYRSTISYNGEISKIEPEKK
ncbi:DUF4251 domain-containing protein [Flavobacterium sp. ZT3R18]|uniref:DUF4251 domain-containing protein n=1 Tax=Flavobacterium sp. ZT3R18 TaxID=2594429 RepID=UPI00117A028E|nr:DUF4251 domain-containing protein [Flavobacterium sp. ZT3R18]TRX37249.1 DUF4251 domain-containing protein [Flavobacterium sp. ZT3R18]